MKTAVVAVVATVAVLSFAALARAQEAVAPAATQADAEVVRILDRQEQASAKFNAFKANMAYLRIDARTDETTTRDGYVAIMRKPKAGPGGIDLHSGLIHFDNLKTDLFASNKKETIAYHDRHLIELNEKTRQLTRREIVPPGQAVNLFRIGEGPFPLPIWQKRQDVLDNFSVRLIPPAKGDPANSDHLELTPLADKELASKHKTISLYYSRESALPVRVVSVDHRRERIIVDFRDIEVDPKLNENDFNLKAPPGYSTSTIPLERTK